MAAAVAHEIRNPLGGIEGFASLLERDLSSTPKSQSMARQIVEGSRTLNRLVSNVLHYARPMEIQATHTDLVAVLQDVKSLIEADSNVSANIDCVLQAPVEAPMAYVDRQLLKSALINLVLNAAQAMPDGGTITLALQMEEGAPVLKVSDTGEGISAGNLEKIFSPFFTTKQDGNGFGLSEVHKIVQAHNASIDVASELDHGTVFSIRLPASNRALTHNTRK